MRTFNRVCTLLLPLAAVVGAVMPVSAAERTPVPIELLARVPEIQSVSMSTDGKSLVALVVSPSSKNQETALATWKLDDLNAGPIITPSGDRMKFIAANAMKADRILAIARQEWTGQLGGCGEGRVTGATKTFITKVYLTDISHKKFKEAFADNTRKLGVGKDIQRCLELVGTASLVSTLPLDPDKVIIRQVNGASLSGNYYLYNLRNDQTELLFKAGGRTSPGLFNPRDGKVLTRTEIEPSGSGEYEQRTWILNKESGQFEQHDKLTTKLSQRHTMEIVGIDETTGKYYVLTDLFSDRIQAWAYDPVAHAFESEPLLAHPEFNISRLILGTRPSNFNRVLGFAVSGATTEVTWIDPAMHAIHDMLSKAYPGKTVSLGDYNDDLSRVLFTTSSPRHAPAYHLLVDKKQVIALGEERPGINPDHIGEQRWVTYTARDGLKIPALLDLPAGWKKEDGPLPTIIHPHGGPWARDFGGWDYSGWVPFLTSRGYAVLRPQYRGSYGLGRELWRAGDAEWGQKMQDDKDDGAAWLVQEGIADKDRIAIFGYSYGGFAAAAAVVRPDGPYQCAISGAPVTDLGKIGRLWSDNRLQRIMQGSTVRGMDPIQNTDKASIPVLLYVGDRDVRTPSFHASDFHKKVKDKVSAKFELIPDMPHSMPWYPRHQQQTLELIENFLTKECGPGGL